MENKYYFENVFESVSSGLIEVECYDLNTDEKVATIELKYLCDEESDEWKVESNEFHTNATIKEITELQEELLGRATDLFHEFCYQCSMYEDYDDEIGWFI